MRRGFIYSVPLPVFRFDKTPEVLEAEEIMKELGIDRPLKPNEALFFHLGYEFGKVDAEYELVKERFL